jgi:hypothetical protein
MVSPHPLFVAPDNPQMPVWRYLDFAKFAHFLMHGELFFPRADLLGDPFEGGVSEMNHRVRPLVYSEHPKILPQLQSLIKTTREAMFVNCWHLSEFESFAMWKVYGGANDSIAVRSDFDTLSRVLPEHSYLGKVNYVDYDSTFIPENNAFAPILHKRHYFAFESEVRAVISLFGAGNPHGWNIIDDRSGIRVRVDLNLLVKGIYVSPAARGWFRDLVEDLIRKHGYEFPIHHSRLRDAPVF